MTNWLISIKYLFRDCIIYNLIFTLFGVYLLIEYSVNSYTYIFWIRVFGYVFTFISYFWYKKKHLYFYHNLGINKRQIGLTVVVVDGILTGLILILTKTVLLI
ncbi:MAG: hypothetical protein AAF693_05600 [Bacteroidota bacterium]